MTDDENVAEIFVVDGAMLGVFVGGVDGDAEGFTEGVVDGEAVGSFDGDADGCTEGVKVGSAEGDALGVFVG